MKRLTAVRKRLETSQSGLARKAGMHVSSISAIEAGRLKPWPGQIARICEAIDWPVERADELFEDVSDDA